MAPKAGSLKTIPWRLVLEVATVAANRFRDDVPPGDRQRLTKLVRKSKGDPRRLTASERSELLAIIKRIDVQRLTRDVSGVVGARKLRQRLGRS